ncbi:heat shock factor 2-binding protein-like [Lytechinus variegatus]|uniref:heat shock factor 2-binding protein-like n=1 Tax=Lytechinus variegatus TaxID=7654 RepID=UPI001BB0F2B7|nr:heat shock factor 2-binding protein-like [Lytechinus variegatus]
MAGTELSEVQGLLKELQLNVTELTSEWNIFKHETTNHQVYNKAFTPVKKTALKDLQTEIKTLKNNLNQTLTFDLIQSLAKEQELEQALEYSYIQTDETQKKCDHWKARHDSTRLLYEQERKEKLSLKSELSKMNQRVSMQSEYCAGMGAICCTLLWRASQHQQTIPALLIGSQMENFMSVVCHTLESFMATYQSEDLPSEQSEELQFVMALCGTVTNIAASSEGREYLSTNPNCAQLIRTFTALLASPSSETLNKLKNLLLMSLYNLSINHKGLQALSDTKDIISLLVSILQGEKQADLRLHTLLLIQSLIMENTQRSILIDVKRKLSMDLLQQLSHDASGEVTEVIADIIQIIKSFDKHEP